MQQQHQWPWTPDEDLRQVVNLTRQLQSHVHALEQHITDTQYAMDHHEARLETQIHALQDRLHALETKSPEKHSDDGGCSIM